MTAPDLRVEGLALDAETPAGRRALAVTPACDAEALVAHCRIVGRAIAAGLMEQLEPCFVLFTPGGLRRELQATIVRAAGSDTAELQASFTGKKCESGDHQVELRLLGMLLASTRVRSPGRLDVQEDLALAAFRVDAIGAGSPDARPLILERSRAVSVRVAVAPQRFGLTTGYPVRGLIQVLGETRATIASIPFTLEADVASGTYRTREPLVIPLPPRAGDYRVAVALVPRILAEETIAVVSQKDGLAAAKVTAPRLVLVRATMAREIGDEIDRSELDGKLVVDFGVDASRAFLPGVRAAVGVVVLDDASEKILVEEGEVVLDRPHVGPVRLVIPLDRVKQHVSNRFSIHLFFDERQVFERELEVTPALVTFNGEGAIVGEVAGHVSDEAHAAALAFFVATPRPGRTSRAG